MLQRVLCPVLVSRERELGALEDALLAANRGDGSIVLSEGEAEFALPDLPFVEAFGNREYRVAAPVPAGA